jgi:hypothetical protein
MSIYFIRKFIRKFIRNTNKNKFYFYSLFFILHFLFLFFILILYSITFSFYSYSYLNKSLPYSAEHCFCGPISQLGNKNIFSRLELSLSCDYWRVRKFQRENCRTRWNLTYPVRFAVSRKKKKR